MKKPKIVQDSVYPNMWRIQWPDGVVSDIVNLSRAKDAVTRFMDSDEARHLDGRATRRARPPVR